MRKVPLKNSRSARRRGPLSKSARPPDQPRAVVLLSGGLDSTTSLAIARRDGFLVTALSFDYGQRHKIELLRAKKIAKLAGVERHVVASIAPESFGGSALTDKRLEVPKNALAADPEKKIPITYVPARNTLFLAHALALAESIGAEAIYIGANALDYSGYPDCRPAFLRAFERAANLGTKAGVTGERRFRIVAPLLRMTKSGIIRLGLRLGVDFSLTSSCYDPSPRGRPCGSCDSCLLRSRGFEDAGVKDPLRG